MYPKLPSVAAVPTTCSVFVLASFDAPVLRALVPIFFALVPIFFAVVRMALPTAAPKTIVPTLGNEKKMKRA